MCCAKRDGQGTYTYAKWEDVNFKLDSPQSESDRGESQLKIERAKWWLHISLPGPSMFEKGYILIRIYICTYIYICIVLILALSPSVSLSLLSQSLLSVRRIILCWSALYLSAIRVFCRYDCLACSLSLFLLAPVLLEEGFVEVWRRMWVRQCGGFLRGFRGVS